MKKYNKQLKESDFEYYYDELNNVTPVGENTVSFQFKGPHKSSKWLTLNADSAKALLHWLQQNMKVK